MLKTIQVKINADSSISANYPYNIYQGEINKNKFVIDPHLVIQDLSNVVGYIGFKRSDNQKSGLVPMEKQADGTFTYVIKDYWTLNLADKVWYTIKFCRTDSTNANVEYQLYVGNSFFTVEPLADYILGDDIPPDTVTILQNEIDTKLDADGGTATNLTIESGTIDENVNVGETSGNHVVGIKDVESIDTLENYYDKDTTDDKIDAKLNKDFTTYEKLEWEEVDNDDLVILNKIEGGVSTPYYAEAKDLYNSVNDIRADEEGNIEITGSDIPVSETNTDSIEDELHKKVNYSVSGIATVPTLTVNYAEYANKDADGNVITSTYVTKSTNQDITGEKTFISTSTGFNDLNGNIKLQNDNDENNTNVVTLGTINNKDIFLSSTDDTNKFYLNNFSEKSTIYFDISNNQINADGIMIYDDSINRIKYTNGVPSTTKLLEESKLVYSGSSGSNLTFTGDISRAKRFIIEEDVVNGFLTAPYATITPEIPSSSGILTNIRLMNNLYIGTSGTEDGKLVSQTDSALVNFSGNSSTFTCAITNLVIQFEPTGGYSVINNGSVTRQIKIYALEV